MFGHVLDMSRTFNQQVLGSNPSALTKDFKGCGQWPRAYIPASHRAVDGLVMISGPVAQASPQPSTRILASPGRHRLRLSAEPLPLP